MTRKRADLGFEAELNDFDPSVWHPQSESESRRAAASPINPEIAKAAGFSSREPLHSNTATRLRRRRTGRNAQINIKTTPETIERFTEIADANGWGLGETFEKAVTLLSDASSRKG